MFGFGVSHEHWLSSWGLSEEPDLTKAKLLDEHMFTVNDISYTQKVWRLEDRSIYTETKPSYLTELEVYEKQKAEAVADQRFEDAAVLRDKIARLLKN